MNVVVTGGTGLVGNGIQYALNQEKKEKLTSMQSLHTYKT
jgi:NAD dependent epimerase/dehydratase family enzyme